MNNTLCEKASLLARKLNCCMPKPQCEAGNNASDPTGGHGWNATIPKNSGSEIRGLMVATGVPESIGLYEPYLVAGNPNTMAGIWFTRIDGHSGVLGEYSGVGGDFYLLCWVDLHQGRLYLKEGPAR